MSRKSQGFQRPTRFTEQIAKTQEFTLVWHDFHRYHAILMDCLPEQWAHRVMPGALRNGRWQLYVAQSSDAYQLHYLLPEIQQRLAEKLPYPPTLKINANPTLWQAFPERRRPVRVRAAHTFSIEEAEAVIARFLQHS